MAASEDDSSRNGDVEAFLSSCAGSGDEAYGAARAVLEHLQAPATRADARRLLGAVRRRLAGDPAAGQEEECFRSFNLRIRDVVLDAHLQGSQQRTKLTMMEIPSVFIPGDLFVTLYEGINHHPDPDSIFRNKTVAQLGCGNGWITIALAEKWCPSKVYGLDINPRVIKIAWINLYLNALDDDGHPIYDREGKTLLDRVEFHESDLLFYCRDNMIELDSIVGCIPQVRSATIFFRENAKRRLRFFPLKRQSLSYNPPKRDNRFLNPIPRQCQRLSLKI